MDYIVRADFYPNGDIIPLGITDCNGNSIFVNKVTETTRTKENSIRFKCSASGGRVFLLSFVKNRWAVSEIY
jgi:hypothetical protein